MSIITYKSTKIKASKLKLNLNKGYTALEAKETEFIKPKKKLGLGALNDKMFLERIIENNKTDAFVGQVMLSKV